MENVGRYQIQGEIARGGMGVIYRAWDSEETRAVAIKLLAGGSSSNREEKRFQREVSALTRLRHSNIVTALDAGEHHGRPYLVMEFVEGSPLSQSLRLGPLPIEEALRITKRLALALQHAHEHNVLHRDVKPSNVVIDSKGEPQLTDFGLMRDMDSTLGGTRLTATGSFLGTPGYWSPEQALGTLDKIGPPTDVYGLGATLYALLTGFPPQGEPMTLEEAVAATLHPPRPPSAERPEIDKALDAICLKCLAKDPEARYPTARAVAEELTSYQGGLHTRKRAWILPVAVGLVVLNTAGWLITLRSSPAEIAALELQPTPEGAEQEPTQAGQDAAQVLDQVSPSPPDLRDNPLSKGVRQRVRRLMLRAQDRQSGGDFQGAIELYGQVLELDPGDAVAYDSRGSAHFRQQNYARAIADYTQAIELDPRFAIAYGNRGSSHFKLGDHEQAIRDLTQAVTIDPGYEEAFRNRGAARALRGDTEGALEDLTRAIDLNPWYAKAHRSRGEIQRERGEFQRALEDYNRAIELEPRYARTYGGRGLARAELGDLPGAIEDYKRALELMSPRDSNRRVIQADLAEAQRALAER